MNEKRKPGRPLGSAPYPVKKLVGLKREDASDLAALAARWRTSDSETIRRAIREAAQRAAETCEAGR